MMRRTRAAAALLTVTALSLAAGSTADQSLAGSAYTGGSAYAATANVNAPSGSLAPTTSVTALSWSGGLLGSLLTQLGGSGLTTLLSSLTSNVANPLATSISALPQTVISGVATGLTSAGLSATNSATQQPRPASGTYPTCDQGGWVSGTGGNCFGPLVSPVTAGTLLGLPTGATQGYATGDASGFIASSQAVHPTLTVLGVPLGDLGTVTATASCGIPPSSTCAATQSATSMSLLNGAITATVADGAFNTVKVNNASLPASGVTLPLAGLPAGLTSAAATLNGNLLTLILGLSTATLLSALGTSISALTSALGLPVSLVDTGSSTTLTVTIGPSSPPVATATTATAYGLAVTASLNADVKLGVTVANLLGSTVTLAALEVKTATPTSQPNLLDIDLGYAAAAAGLAVPGWIAPGAI